MKKFVTLFAKILPESLNRSEPSQLWQCLLQLQLFLDISPSNMDSLSVSVFPVLYQMVSLITCLGRLPELFSTERLTSSSI